MPLIYSNNLGPRDNRTEPKRVSDDVKTFFKKKGITLIQVADRLGITKESLGYYLNGKKFMPDNVALLLNEMFNFDLYYLLNGSIEGIPSTSGDAPYIIEHTLMGVEGVDFPEKEVKMTTKQDDIERVLDDMRSQLKLLEVKQQIMRSTENDIAAIIKFIKNSLSELDELNKEESRTKNP